MEYNQNPNNNHDDDQNEYKNYTYYQYGYQSQSQPESQLQPQQAEPQPEYGHQPHYQARRRRGSGTLKVVALALLFGFVGGFGGTYAGNAILNTQDNTSLVGNTGGGEIKTINIESSDTFPVSAISEKVSPSVVGIVVKFPVTSMMGYFGGRGTYESGNEGSGVIYSPDGYIITNYHVIGDALDNYGAMLDGASIDVYLPSDLENPISAEVVGFDISMDLAVLKIGREGLPAAEIGDSDAISVGDIAVAIGNPGGMSFAGSTSFGVISGLNRTITLESGASVNVIQTDAAINPGNSGGALVNERGQLIGINSAKLASSDYEGMGFALPVNAVVEIVDRLIANEGSAIPYIGIVEDTRYSSSLLQSYGYPSGVVIYQVVEGSPAESAGLQEGDIITAFNGVDTPTLAILNNEKNKCHPGDDATITVYRAGESVDISLTLSESLS